MNIQANLVSDTDYSDTFKGIISSDKNLKLEIIVQHFFTFSPVWIKFLFRLRDFLVRPFGLKTAKDDETESMEKGINLSKGSTLGLFEVIDGTDDEVLFYYSDSHLVAWFFILVIRQINYSEVEFTTLVHYNNLLGRIYFFFIKPFHKLIVKSQLKNLAGRFGA